MVTVSIVLSIININLTQTTKKMPAWIYQVPSLYLCRNQYLLYIAPLAEY